MSETVAPEFGSALKGLLRVAQTPAYRGELAHRRQRELEELSDRRLHGALPLAACRSFCVELPLYDHSLGLCRVDSLTVGHPVAALVLERDTYGDELRLKLVP